MKEQNKINFKEYFIDEYEQIEDILDKCQCIHKKVAICNSAIERVLFCYELINYFSEGDFHLSELKTVLIVTKGMRHNSILNVVRHNLLMKYEIQKNGK